MCITFITVNKILTNLCHSEYSKCPLATRLQVWIRRRRWSCNDIFNNALFHSSPCINKTLPQIIYILHFCLVDTLLNYAADVVNRMRSRLFGDHKPGVVNAWCTVGFTRLLRVASLQTLQTKITGYNNHDRALEETRISQLIDWLIDWLNIWCVAGLLDWVSAAPPQTHFLPCVCVCVGGGAATVMPVVGTWCFSQLTQ